MQTCRRPSTHICKHSAAAQCRSEQTDVGDGESNGYLLSGRKNNRDDYGSFARNQNVGWQRTGGPESATMFCLPQRHLQAEGVLSHAGAFSSANGCYLLLGHGLLYCMALGKTAELPGILSAAPSRHRKL
ncbi:hypothetical protein D4764_01G0008450 [Takifugu flavidus]|uniref:Uncharacterized protein n=1 Tax=Takifugu flavidus TaxID=433684 RepID=A0A5C6PRY4_9TELE|nr:hypothetical protein D4764_01G0008450 [Takifugu flavidus]